MQASRKRKQQHKCHKTQRMMIFSFNIHKYKRCDKYNIYRIPIHSCVQAEAQVRYIVVQLQEIDRSKLLFCHFAFFHFSSNNFTDFNWLTVIPVNDVFSIFEKTLLKSSELLYVKCCRPKLSLVLLSRLRSALYLANSFCSWVSSANSMNNNYVNTVSELFPL